MEVVELIGILATPMIVVVALLFMWCLVALIIATYRRKTKIVLFPASLLVGSIIIFIAAKHFITYELTEIVADQESSINFSPRINMENRRVYSEIMSNLYQLKGKSGSHPTENKHIITVCNNNEACASVELGQDSRNPDMYWVGYKLSKSSVIPLGYVKLNPGYLEGGS